MEYRKFGPTDLTVSALGFGCYDAAGGGYGDKMAAAVQQAVDLGITCFDTAAGYGNGESERMLGKALGPRRKKVVVVTKCGVNYAGRPKGRDSRRESILASVDNSLQRLQTDYIDVMLVHLPDVNTPFDETMGALDTAVQQGKVRAVGVFCFTLEQLKECEQARRVDVVQYIYHMFDRRMAHEIFPHCLQQGMGVMAHASMGFGILAGAYAEDQNFGDNDFRATGGNPDMVVGIYDKDAFQRNVRLVNDLKPIAENRGKTMPQLALRWVLSHPAISVALVGTLNTQQLEENVGALDWALSAEDMRQIDEVFARYGVDTNPPCSPASSNKTVARLPESYDSRSY